MSLRGCAAMVAKLLLTLALQCLPDPPTSLTSFSNMVGAKEDCSNFNGLPKIGFQIGDKVLNLKPDDYMDSSASDCSFSLMALDVPPPKGPLFIFGDPFLRRFVTIFDRKGPRVGFAVAKHSDDNTPASELISHVGAATSDAGSPPEGGLNPSAVNLHLDSGLMGPGEGESSDDTPTPPAPTPVSPPPAPAWVPPPSPPPFAVDAGSSLDSSDPFGLTGGSTHFPTWSSADDAEKTQAATPAQAIVPDSDYEVVPGTSSNPGSDYEKILFGGSAKDNSAAPTYTSSYETVATTAESPVNSMVKSDTASIVSDDPFAAAFSEPAVPPPAVTKPAAHIEKVEPTDNSGNSQQAFDIWSATQDFDSRPAAQSPVANSAAVAQDSKPTDWSKRWASGLDDNVANEFSITDDSVPSSSKAPRSPTQDIKEDSIARMRRLFKENALLQKQKKGHLISIKLHRGH